MQVRGGVGCAFWVVVEISAFLCCETTAFSGAPEPVFVNLRSRGLGVDAGRNTYQQTSFFRGTGFSGVLIFFAARPLGGLGVVEAEDMP